MPERKTSWGGGVAPTNSSRLSGSATPARRAATPNPRSRERCPAARSAVRRGPASSWRRRGRPPRRRARRRSVPRSPVAVVQVEPDPAAGDQVPCGDLSCNPCRCHSDVGATAATSPPALDTADSAAARSVERRQVGEKIVTPLGVEAVRIVDHRARPSRRPRPRPPGSSRRPLECVPPSRR